MTKEKNMKCGFCDEEIKDPKELRTIKNGRKFIITCPFCNSVLGIYYIPS